MAMNIYVKMTANGSDIAGESTVESMDRADLLEVYEMKWGVNTAREGQTQRAVGRRRHLPIRMLKRIDKASPLLFKALCQNEEIEATYRMFRPNPVSGETEEYFNIVIGGGRISSIEGFQPNTALPDTSTLPDSEWVDVVFHTVTWTHMTESTEHSDDWRMAEN